MPPDRPTTPHAVRAIVSPGPTTALTGPPYRRPMPPTDIHADSTSYAVGRVAPLVALLVAAVALLAACAGDDDRERTAPDTQVADTEVLITDMSFRPARLIVAVGDPVTWSWEDGDVPHDVTFDDGPASPLQDTGTWTRTFDEPGTYPYVCSIHPGMTGTVTVR